MQYLDFDLEIGEGTGREYPVIVRSPAGEAHTTMRFPYDAVTLESYLSKLKIALLRSNGPTRRRALTSEEQVVQDFGQHLFDALLAGDVRALYDVSRRDADERDQGLRLKLHIRASGLAALPWEYLYDSRTGEYLCLSHLTPLVRYLDLPRSAQPLRVTLPLRILGVIASPSDLEALDIEREQMRMQAALKDLERKGLVTLKWLGGQTWRDLRRALSDEDWHIIHFIGHGGFDLHLQEGVIALANEEGRRHLLTATQMGNLLAGHRPLRLVLLNACSGAQAAGNDLFSSTAAVLSRRGIPAVLAMQEEITDRAAIEFTRTFYEEMALGRSVDAAVTEGRIAIRIGAAGTLEWGTPVLYMRALDGVLFDLPNRSEEREKTQTNLQQPPVVSQRPEGATIPQRATSTSSKSLRTSAFISYSHIDKKYLEQLHVHLAPYIRKQTTDIWDDTKIKPGSKWREEIEKAINAARVAVLLVSAEFLASEFITDNELPSLLAAAKQEGATILCVILGPCAFLHTELAQFQAVNPPSQPLAGMIKVKREGLWARVAELVNEALNA